MLTPWCRGLAPIQRVLQYHVLAEYLSGILSRNALVAFVRGAVCPQYINYILENFLGQIIQHSCAIHKCVCYLKYANYSVHLWFWFYMKCQSMSSENKFILMQLITHWKKKNRLMLLLHKFFRRNFPLGLVFKLWIALTDSYLKEDSNGLINRLIFKNYTVTGNVGLFLPEPKYRSTSARIG